MNPLQDRRVLMAGGAAAALLAGVLIALFLTRGAHAPENVTDNTAAPGALQVQQVEQPKLDPDRQLRCFVGGQFIGAATLADCAKKNGVAAQALDVGLDQSGALAAGGDQLKPLPQVAPPAQVAITQPPPAPATTLQTTPTLTTGSQIGECLRYGTEGWRPVGGGLSISACVQTLFAGRCQRPGEALYGRWAGQSLRLVPGRVETSGDNKDFHTLVDQARDCSIPPL